MQGISFEHRDWPRAQEQLTRATAVASENDVLFYNLGLIYQRFTTIVRGETTPARPQGAGGGPR